MRFPQKTVYLAGPITGLSYQEARHTWRQEFSRLVPAHIHCLSPMRAKDFLLDQQVLVGDPDMYPQHLMATASGIVTRDRNDVKNCDAMVAVLSNAEKASVGTCIEFGWADAFRKPIVMVIEDQADADHMRPDLAPNPHWHAMLTEISGYVTPSLDEAAHIVTHLLTPGI